MGHYASEIDPDWNRRIDETNIRIKLFKKLKNVPLSTFTVGDLSALIKLVSSGDPISPASTFKPSEKDLSRLEAKLNKQAK